MILEFFKPTKIKLLLFIFLLLLLPIFIEIKNPKPCVDTINNVSPLGGLCEAKLESDWRIIPSGGALLISAVLWDSNKRVVNLFGYDNIGFIGIFKILYIIIWPYLISCLIVFLYNKRFKKSPI